MFIKHIKTSIVNFFRLLIWVIIFPIRLIKLLPSALRSGNFRFVASLVLILYGLSNTGSNDSVASAIGSTQIAAGLYIVASEAEKMKDVFTFNITWKSFWTDVCLASRLDYFADNQDSEWSGKNFKQSSHCQNYDTNLDLPSEFKILIISWNCSFTQFVQAW